MTLKQKIIEIISKESLVYSSPDNLFLFLSNACNKPIQTIKKEFDLLLKNGDIFEVRKGKFIPIPSRGYVKGKFVGNSKGYGFCDMGIGDDLFIPASKVNTAIDGDLVICKTYSNDEGSEGEVAFVYKKIDKLVGVVTKISKNYFLEPDNNRITAKFLVKKAGAGIRDGEKVVAKISREKDLYYAEIIPSSKVFTSSLWPRSSLISA